MMALLRGRDAGHVVEPRPAHLHAALELHARALIHEVAEQRIGLPAEHGLLFRRRIGDGDQLHVADLHVELAHESGEDREAGVAGGDGNAAVLDFLDFGRPRIVGAVDERHRALLQRHADRLDRHAGVDAAHHRRRINIGHRIGRVGGQLRHRGRAAAFEDLDVEADVLVEALVASDEERRVLAIQRPIQAKRKFLERLGARRRRECDTAAAAISDSIDSLRFMVFSPPQIVFAFATKLFCCNVDRNWRSATSCQTPAPGG